MASMSFFFDGGVVEGFKLSARVCWGNGKFLIGETV